MKPINVGTRRELMVDDYLLEQFSGDAKLLLHNPTPQEIVFPNTTVKFSVAIPCGWTGLFRSTPRAGAVK